MNESTAARRAFVVIGMHRSGTSAMTRVLSLLGAELPKVMLPAAQDNEIGFWEPQSVALLNEEILQALDSEWDDVFAFRPREYLSNFDRFYLGRAVELLEQEFSRSEVIVLKDPRISVLTTFWQRALEEAGYTTHYVVMVRNPLEVAESLRARNGFPREKSLLLWSSYMIAADRDTRGSSRTFVNYDQLMQDWRSVRTRIEQNAGVPFPRDTAVAAIEVDRFLDRSLRHHELTSTDFFSRSDVSEEIKTLYRIFIEACEGADVDSVALEAIRTEMEKVELLVGPLVADLRASARKLSKEVHELAAAHGSARDRVDALEAQLAEERGLRTTEAETMSKMRSEYEQRLAELAATIAATEADREALAAEIQEQARRELLERDRLQQQITALTEEIARREAVAASLGAVLKTKEAELTAQVELLANAQSDIRRSKEESQREIERLRRLFDDDLRRAAEERKEAEAALKRKEAELSAQEGEMERLRHGFDDNLRKAAEERNEAEAALKRKEAELAAQQEIAGRVQADILRSKDESERELERVKSAFARDLQVAQEARNKADAAARTTEGKLTQRFQEVATLTNLLRDETRRGERVQKQVECLVALNQRLENQPRWWSVMPASWRRRRVLNHLRNVGLFDGDEYLRRYPDVAAENMDPLDHYLRHGFEEGRLAIP